MVKIDDGENKRTTFRSEKVERRIKSLEDRKRLELIEKLYGQISQQVDSDFEKKQKLIRTPKKKVKDIEDGKELWELLQYTNDPDGIEVTPFLKLFPSQSKLSSFILGAINFTST